MRSPPPPRDLNHVVDSIFRRCENVLYLFRLSPLQRKEDYQVSRISHEGLQGHLPSPLAKFSGVSTLKIFRVVSSNELHAKIARPLSAV